MKEDKRGFMASMTAMMVVIASLTLFMGVICCVQPSGEESGNDYGFVERLEIVDGEIIGDFHEDIVYLVESKGYTGMEVRVNVIGTIDELSFYDSFGDTGTGEVTVERGSFEMQADDGRRLVAGYEVIIWR